MIITIWLWYIGMNQVVHIKDNETNQKMG